MKNICIGIPCYDGKLHASFFISLMQFLMAGSTELTAPPRVNILYGESHVNRARNRIAKDFLDSDCTHLLFVDSDIIFKPEHITALLKRDLPIVAGLYPKKEAGPAQWVYNALEGAKPDDTGLLEVKFVGTGFMLIAREVFKKMIIPPIEYQDDSAAKMGTMWNFFHSAIWGNQWLSEDWWFCKEWRNMGGKIYADTTVLLGHTGAINFPIEQTAKQPDYSSGIAP